ncbi:MAG: S8 family serine peptidase [Gemmatimonadetes bacterium]|nr:S8 family serine peptidase [Gemmatimonadota bacterium]
MIASLAPLPHPAWVRDALGPVTGRGVRVAVIDSGWDVGLRVEGLRVEPGASFVGTTECSASPEDVQDRLGHGTSCATTVHRIAPDALLCPVRIFGATLETSIPEVRRAILWAVERGFDVVNLSLGTALPEAVVPLYAACEAALRAGTVVVAASSGAEGCYPAAFDNVLSVGAGPYTDPFRFVYREDDAVECLAARGIEGRVVSLGGEARVADGPSFAAPNVAGIAALIRERFPGSPLSRVRELLAGLSTSPPP